MLGGMRAANQAIGNCIRSSSQVSQVHLNASSRTSRAWRAHVPYAPSSQRGRPICVSKGPQRAQPNAKDISEGSKDRQQVPISDDEHELEAGAEAEEGEWDEDEWEEDEGEWEEGDEEQEVADEDEQETEQESTVRQIPVDQEQVPYTEGDFVEVGVVGKAFGILGEVRVQPITDEPRKRLGTAGTRLWLQPPAPQASQPLQRAVVASGRVVKPSGARPGEREVWAVRFKEVKTRKQAEQLSQHKLLLAVCDRERLRSADTYYISDLVGLAALDHASGKLIGQVTEVCDGTGTFDTLRLRLVPTREDIVGSRYRTALVPFVKEMVPVVDLKDRVLRLAPPEGLLDLAAVRKLSRPYSEAQVARMLAQLEAREGGALQQQEQEQQEQGQEQGGE